MKFADNGGLPRRWLMDQIARPGDRNRRIHRTRDGHALEGFGLKVDCVDGPPRQIPPSIIFRAPAHKCIPSPKRAAVLHSRTKTGFNTLTIMVKKYEIIFPYVILR